MTGTSGDDTVQQGWRFVTLAENLPTRERLTAIECPQGCLERGDVVSRPPRISGGSVVRNEPAATAMTRRPERFLRQMAARGRGLEC
jgi:hypothetical protein